MKKQILLFFVVLTALSCNKKEEVISVGIQYYPTEAGHFKEYIVDSIIYFESKKIRYDTALIREETSPTYIDSAGKETQDIKVLWSKFTQPPEWFHIQTYSVNVDGQSAQEFKNNRREIKLSFPIYNDKKWNINNYSNKIPVFAKYQKVFDPYQSKFFNFENTISTNSVSPSTLNIYRLREVYAKNVGLVERILVDYEHQTLKKTRDGFEVKMILRKHK